MWSPSTAHPPIPSQPSTDPASFRLQRRHDFEYPPLSTPTIRHECLNSVPLPRIRENCLLIKLYVPGGFTKSGLFIEPKKGPAIWGHILAFHPNIRPYVSVEMTPGDMVLFHRYADDTILVEGSLTVSMVHVTSIQALFTPPLVELCIS